MRIDSTTKMLLPYFAVAGIATFGVATACLTYSAHVESDKRAHALEITNENHRLYMELVESTASDRASIGTSVAIEEDAAEWDCAADGNRICGPSNLAHVAGCYSDTGTLVAEWPCTVVINLDGSSDIYVP